MMTSTLYIFVTRIFTIWFIHWRCYIRFFFWFHLVRIFLKFHRIDMISSGYYLVALLLHIFVVNFGKSIVTTIHQLNTNAYALKKGCCTHHAVLKIIILLWPLFVLWQTNTHPNMHMLIRYKLQVFKQLRLIPNRIS